MQLPHYKYFKFLISVFLVLFFFVCSSHSLENQNYKITLKENTGGLNSKASPVTLKNNESSDLMNVDLDTDGSIRKRRGYTVLNNTSISSKKVDGLYAYYLNSGTRHLIAAANGIYKMDNLDGTWDAITNTAITANKKARFTSFQNTMFMTNGTDPVQEWSGTGNCTDSQCNSDISLSKAKYLSEYDNRLFLANVTVSSADYPSRLYYSELFDKDVWDANQYITAGFNDGDVITGVVNLGGYLYVFKTKSIYKVKNTGDSAIPYTVEKTNATDGCISPDSLQIISNGLVIFLSQQGIAVFDGNTTEIISYKIKPTIDDLAGTNLIESSSCVYKTLNQYWLSVSDGDSGDRIIIWDYYHNAFLLHSGIHARSFSTIIDSSENERLYFGDYIGYVYRADTGTDDYPGKTITAINAYYTTKHYDFDYLFMTKVPRYIVVIFQYSNTPSVLNISYAYDLQTTDHTTETFTLQNPVTAIWDISLWDVDLIPGSGASYYRVDLQSQGITMRFKFSNNALGQTFSIYGWEVAYNMGGIVEN